MTIDTGVSFPEGFDEDVFVHIATRSSTAALGVQVLGGIIDCSYTGNIKVCLHNSGEHPFRVNAGDAIAQLIMVRGLVRNRLFDVGEAAKTRKDKGFGSTNKRTTKPKVDTDAETV